MILVEISGKLEDIPDPYLFDAWFDATFANLEYPRFHPAHDYWCQRAACIYKVIISKILDKRV